MRKKLVFTLLLSLLFFENTFACETPVYIYALQNWKPDNYTLHIVKDDGAISSADSALISEIRTAVSDRYSTLNSSVSFISENEAAQICEDEYDLSGFTLPYCVLTFPRSGASLRVASVFNLNKNNVDSFINSKLRNDIVHSITQELGSAVFVVAGSDEKKVSKTLVKLNKYLKKAESEVVLSIPVEGAEVRFVGFSALENKESEERLFVETLRRSFGIEKKSDVDVFMIYGAGRAGSVYRNGRFSYKDIKADADFVTGECSCELKSGNPGTDMLIRADWSTAYAVPGYTEQVLPVLTTVEIGDTDDSVETESLNSEQPEKSFWWLPVPFAALLGVLAGSFFYFRKKK